MTLVAIDADSFAKTDLTFAHASGSDIATFTFPVVKVGDPAKVVSVATDGTNLMFFPRRSAGQRAVLKALGIPW